MQNAVVYRCVRMIAEAAASIPILLYDRDTELSDHPLIALLKAPSPGLTGQDFFESWYGYLLVSGNTYAEVVTLDGIPRELHALRPDRMAIVRHRAAMLRIDVPLAGPKPTTTLPTAERSASAPTTRTPFRPSCTCACSTRHRAAMLCIDQRPLRPLPPRTRQHGHRHPQPGLQMEQGAARLDAWLGSAETPPARLAHLSTPRVKAASALSSLSASRPNSRKASGARPCGAWPATEHAGRPLLLEGGLGPDETRQS